MTKCQHLLNLSGGHIGNCYIPPCRCLAVLELFCTKCFTLNLSVGGMTWSGAEVGILKNLQQCRTRNFWGRGVLTQTPRQALMAQRGAGKQVGYCPWSWTKPHPWALLLLAILKQWAPAHSLQCSQIFSVFFNLIFIYPILPSSCNEVKKNANIKMWVLFS